MSDLIDRDDAIEAVKVVWQKDYAAFEEVRNAIYSLPAAEKGEGYKFAIGDPVSKVGGGAKREMGKDMKFNERAVLLQMQNTAIEQYVLIRKIIGRLSRKDEEFVSELVQHLINGTSEDRRMTLNTLHSMLFNHPGGGAADSER